MKTVLASTPNSSSFAPAAHWHGHNHQSHVVQFYGTDDFLIKSLARFVGTALGAGDAALVIATKSHRDALIENLKANGLDTARGIKQGRFVILDAAETLSKITADGMPDAGLFNDVVGGTIGRLIAAMQREDVQIAAFGEMVSLLWADGNCDAAVRLEQLWNDLAKTYSFSLHCAYPISGFNREEHAEAFAKICAEHSAVLPHESYGALENEEGRLREIAQLQQKEQVYDALRQAKQNLEKEIRERTEVERKLRVSENSLRNLSGHLLRLQDEERRRLGRDLHDSLGQYLAALKMCLETLKVEQAARGIDAGRQLFECLRLADESMREVRTISYLLYPPMLEELGLKTAIPWYLEGFAKRSGIEIDLDISPSVRRLPREVELAMFRVLQESLTNVHRHSESPTAHVRVLAENGNAIVEIKDHGKGIPRAILDSADDGSSSLGVGLRGMHERVRQLGGKLELLSSGGETIVRATIPCAGLASRPLSGDAA